MPAFDPSLIPLAAETVTGELGRAGNPDLLSARQMQALSLAVHIPLVCFGIAFPAMVLFVEGLYLRTGNPVYKALAKRWSKVMLILFAVGVSARVSDGACSCTVLIRSPVGSH